MGYGVRRVLVVISRWPTTALRGLGAAAVLCLSAALLAAQTTPAASGRTIAPSRPSGSSPSTALSTAAEPACKIQGPIANWDASAQLIAGISDEAFREEFTDEQKAAWTDYSKTAAADWRRLKLRYVDRIAAWRARNLLKSTPIDAVFYPFSGPDATNAMAFFPDAHDYTLVGLEPVGCIPSNAGDFAPEYWPALRQGWRSAVVMGFFKTEDMERDLAKGNVGGVLPVLLIAHAGNTIVDVSPIGITPSGALVTPSGSVKTETRGVAIQFRGAPPVTGGAPGNSGASRSAFLRPTPNKSTTNSSAANTQIRTLRYFALNLINTRLKKKPGTTKYLQGLPASATLVKSASYLMHKRYFSNIRGMIIAKSSLVIEDDSGVPFHYFDPALWDVRLFGAYDKPIDLFQDWMQDDLKAAYDGTQNVQPLDFGISYKFRIGESNLMLAMRKGK
jgi:hypothetical protein